MKRTIILAIAAACTLSGCKNSGFSENAFLTQTTSGGDNDIALMEKGTRILTYDPATWQLGYNDAKKEFRVSDDNMNYYYIVRCNTMPSEEGQTIDATLEWTTYNDNMSKSLTFKVSKIDSDGKIWLYSAKGQIGVVVKEVK